MIDYSSDASRRQGVVFLILVVIVVSGYCVGTIRALQAKLGRCPCESVRRLETVTLASLRQVNQRSIHLSNGLLRFIRIMIPTATTTRTEFYGDSWLYRTGAFLSALLAFICVLIAILFLCGISKPANGIPGGVAAVRLLLVAVPICFFAILFWFHVLARRRPLLRICQERLEVNIVGRGSLDLVPGIPTSIKLVWLVLSMQGFRKQIGWVP